jgi:hypothetical protein
MPRERRFDTRRELPPPLPPERRTVGQLVGETLRLYGSRFWFSLSLGIPVVVVNAVAWNNSSGDRRLVLAPVSALLLPLSYVAASALVTHTSLRTRRAVVAYATAVLVFIPFPFLVTLFILPGLVWLALFGLAIPAMLAERLSLRDSLRRGLALGRADLVHVLGSLATLGLIVVLVQAGLYFVLREFADNTQRVAAALASLVVSPLVFLGAALLYVDQEARLRSRAERGKERHADVPDADDAHREGGPDPAREPGTVA